MLLMQDSNWKAVHFENRTVLRVDRNLYPQATWEYLVNKMEVEPMAQQGHYKAIEVKLK